MHCHDCDERDGELVPATQLWDRGADHAFWTGESRWIAVCDECFSRHDNYEPPDPDGEAFRGGEAEAYANEQMAKAQRLK